VKELIQSEMNAANIIKELFKILHDDHHYQSMKADFQELKEKLKTSENASARVAQSIFDLSAIPLTQPE
jgi:lipid A disaccharide synthetase